MGTLSGHRQGGVAPPQGIGNCLGGGIGQHGQDEGLGVPEGMAVIARPRQALGRDGPPLGACAGLEHVEQGEAHRLLDLGVTVDLDVGATPEVVQIGALLVDQAVPARLDRSREGGGDLVSHRRLRTLRGPTEGDEFDDAQPLAGLEGGSDGHPAEIGEALGRHLLATREPRPGGPWRRRPADR